MTKWWPSDKKKTENIISIGNCSGWFTTQAVEIGLGWQNNTTDNTQAGKDFL